MSSAAYSGNIKTLRTRTDLTTSFVYTDHVGLGTGGNQTIFYIDLINGAAASSEIAIEYANTISKLDAAYGSLVGTFTVGEIVSNGKGSTAKILEDDGSTLLIAMRDHGSFENADDLLGETSGATAALSAEPSVSNVNFYPETYLTSDLKLQDLTYTIEGATRQRLRLPVPQKDSYVRAKARKTDSGAGAILGIDVITANA